VSAELGDPVDVCAVLYGDSRGELLDELVAAVTHQSARPAVILQEPELTAGVRAAAGGGTRWIWLLEIGTVPAPDALRDLLDAVAKVTPPAPMLMASKVVDQHGRLHTDATPRHELFEKQHSVDAAEHRLVQLRTAAPGSVLVATAAIARVGLPRTDLPAGLDVVEWSARMLRDWEDTGYLVPASVAVRRTAPAPRRWGYWLGRARILGSGGWSATERLWETFLLGEAIADAIRDGEVRGARESGRRTSARRAAPGESRRSP
jgi:hypothetical protein